LKSIVGFERYLVDQEGNIYSTLSGEAVKMSLQVNADGYYVINLFRDGKYFHRRVNRLVAETYISNPKNLPVVHHKDDDRKNNRVGNLEWCTALQNNNYKVERNRQSFGETHGMVELTEEQVLDIYSRLLEGAKLGIASEYNVSERTIARIKSKQGWLHILKDLPDIPIKSFKAPLKEHEVRDICERLAKGQTQKAIADEYGIDRQVVLEEYLSNILANNTTSVKCSEVILKRSRV